MHLRCPSGILHGIIVDNGFVEFRCRSKRCGHKAGVVVLHKFNLKTGKMIKTSYFAEPLERKVNAHSSIRSAIRSA